MGLPSTASSPFVQQGARGLICFSVYKLESLARKPARETLSESRANFYNLCHQLAAQEASLPGALEEPFG